MSFLTWPAASRIFFLTWPAASSFRHLQAEVVRRHNTPSCGGLAGAWPPLAKRSSTSPLPCLAIRLRICIVRLVVAVAAAAAARRRQRRGQSADILHEPREEAARWRSWRGIRHGAEGAGGLAEVRGLNPEMACPPGWPVAAPAVSVGIAVPWLDWRDLHTATKEAHSPAPPRVLEGTELAPSAQRNPIGAHRHLGHLGSAPASSPARPHDAVCRRLPRSRPGGGPAPHQRRGSPQHCRGACPDAPPRLGGRARRGRRRRCPPGCWNRDHRPQLHGPQGAEAVSDRLARVCMLPSPRRPPPPPICSPPAAVA